MKIYKIKYQYLWKEDGFEDSTTTIVTDKIFVNTPLNIEDAIYLAKIKADNPEDFEILSIKKLT